MNILMIGIAVFISITASHTNNSYCSLDSDASPFGLWFPLGTGANGIVKTICPSGGDIYIGGSFTYAGDVSNTSRIARWDGSSWHSLETGLNYDVNSIAALGSNLYVGGHFSNAGGDPNAKYIARWDGSNWHALSSQTPHGAVEAVAVSGSNVFVGGGFPYIEDVPNTGGIARWDGSNWHALGSGGGDGDVHTIAILGSNVFVGGLFDSMGDVPNTAGIARWDGSTWHSLNSDFTSESSVFALCASGSDLLVGGNFQNAGGNPDADYIARWDGSSWHSIGTGLEATVYALIPFGNCIYAGGFSDIYNSEQIAVWDGSTWGTVGGGLNTAVNAFASSGSSLYVGGQFYDAGGNPDADRIVRWTDAINIVNVTEPNSSTTWTHGEYNLETMWEYPSSDYFTSSSLLQPCNLNKGSEIVDIYLYKGADMVAILASEISNYGAWIYQGPVPEVWSPGSYKIYIEDGWGNYGWSEEFIIQAAAGIESPDELNSALFHISPNPSIGDVIVEYNLSQPSLTELSIYDLSGRHVSSIASGESSIGIHQVQINNLSQGTYLCQLRVGLDSYSQKFVVIK